MASKEAIPNTRISKDGIYEVQIAVPARLHAVMGVKWLIGSTGKRDPKEARKERDIIVGQFRQRLRDAESMAPVPMAWRLARSPAHVSLANLSPEVAARISDIICAEFPDALPAISGGIGRVPVQVPAAHNGPVYLDHRNGEIVEPITMPLAGCSFASVVNLWANTRQKQYKAKAAMLSKMERLAGFLTHDDMTRVSRLDCQRYKESLVAGMNAGSMVSTTCQDHIEMLRAIFRFAHENQKIEPNPMERVRWDAGNDGRTAERENFSAEQRAMIVRAAMASTEPGIKWATMIAAYSGARLAEIVEAHTADIFQEDGVWVFAIRLDNRPKEQQIKTNFSKRRFPIHSAVLEAGFLDYLNSLSEGPLFPGFSLYHGRRNTYASRTIMRWMRQIGIRSESKLKLLDFHSWRHTIATILANAKIHPDRVRYVVGHAPSSKHAGYLHHSTAELREAIEAIPTVTP